MATVSQNIATIIAKAAELDTLIGQFQAAKAAIDAAETEIRKAQPNADHDAIAGRTRLALYGYALMVNPALNGGQTVAALASAAWEGVS
jgi:hypothetical protein